jgi:hypothetical protein
MAKEKDDEKNLQEQIKETAEKGGAKKFDPAWLKGLTYSFAEDEVIEKNGRKVHRPIAKKRPLKETDLMSWKDHGETIVIATKDGKKYSVKK